MLQSVAVHQQCAIAQVRLGSEVVKRVLELVVGVHKFPLLSEQEDTIKQALMQYNCHYIALIDFKKTHTVPEMTPHHGFLIT